MTAFSVHMCLCVRGALKQLNASRAKKSCFNDDHGRPLSRLEAIDGLLDELTKGHETIPMHKGCANPCKNSAKCKGFDYGPEGGCPGHPIGEGEPA